MRGERVEVRVGGRVVRLPRRAEQTRHGGEQHEGDGLLARQLVQVPGRCHLGAQHRVDPVRGEGLHRRIGQHACRVHDRRQRTVGRNVVAYADEVVAVGGVRGDDPHLGAGCGQRRRQLGGTGAVRPTPAAQHQAAYPVCRDEVAGQQRAEPTGATDDPHRATGMGKRGGWGRSGAGEHRQPGHPQLPGPYCDLRLPGRERGTQQAVAPVVEVDQDEPAGMFGLRGTQQPPDGRGVQVADALTGPGGHGVPGDDGQPGIEQRRIGQPVLHEP